MNRIITLFIKLSIVLLLPSVGAAQTSHRAYNFLNVPLSGHAAAMGGCSPALISDDALLIQQNPALLGPELDTSVALSYMRYIGTSNMAGAVFSKSAGHHGAWAAGLRYLNYGTIESIDESGITDGTSFSPYDLVAGGAYSHDITDRLRGAISINLIYSNYASFSALAIAADLGISYYDDDKDLSLALVLKNAGGQVKRFDTQYQRLPFDIQLGYMQGLGRSPFTLSITAFNLTRWKMPYYRLSSDGTASVTDNFASNLFSHLVFGLQYSPSERFYIAAGYNHKTRNDIGAASRSILSGFSAGIGMRLKWIGFDVAFASPHRNTTTIVFNISTNIHDLLQ